MCSRRGVIDHRATTTMSKTSGSESSSGAEDQVLNLSRSGNANAASVGQRQIDDRHGSSSDDEDDDDDDNQSEDLMTARSSYLKAANDSD